MSQNLFQNWRQRGRAQILAALLLPVWLVTGCRGQDLSAGVKNPALPAPVASSSANPKALAAGGHKLFLMNCAHCHAADATGDEGPDLHGLTKSDLKLATLIKNGVKGEMPRFGAKFSDADVQALVAFIDSMK